MNVSLTPELEKFVKQKVDSKLYQTSSEVVRQALRVMQLQEEYDKARLHALRRDIQVGADQLERGEFMEIGNEKDQKELVERIKRNGRARLTALKKQRSA